MDDEAIVVCVCDRARDQLLISILNKVCIQGHGLKIVFNCQNRLDRFKMEEILNIEKLVIHFKRLIIFVNKSHKRKVVKSV